MKMKMKMKMKQNHCRGFTLIELAIVIIITGLLFVPLVRQYSIYEMDKRVEDTKDAISLSSSLIARLKIDDSVYPCPADPTLPTTDPMYGIAQCAAAAGLPAFPGVGCVGGLCVVTGARPDSNGVNTRVLVGSMPIRTLQGQLQGDSFSNQGVIDAWGGRIMYAVSEDLTVSGSYNYYNGVIRAIDENNNPTAGVQNDAHYVVWSSGPDQRGGFHHQSGVAMFPCGTAANSRDFENCDGDSTFVQAGGYYLGTGGNTYYDDSVFFGKELTQSIWAYEVDMINIKTTTTGMVGVGTNAPNEKLDIQDGLGTAGVSVNNSVFTKEICANDGVTCFNVERITGSNFIRCNTPGTVMVGISLANEVCVAPVYAVPIQRDCGPGKWVRGFKTNGDVICYP